MKILIVEDEESIVECMRWYFKEVCGEECVVDATSSGSEGVKKLEDTRYDIVVTDMGVGSSLCGCDVVNKGKELGVWTVVCTGLMQDYYRQHCSPDYILPKTFSHHDITKMVEKWKGRPNGGFKSGVESKYKVVVRRQRRVA